MNQFEQQHHLLKNKLERVKQENALLKYSLSDMVDKDVENNFLLVAEYFQNELLLTDDMLKKLIKNLQEFSGRIRKYQNESFVPEKIIKDNEKIYNGILKFEKEFLKLSEDFNARMLRKKKH